MDMVSTKPSDARYFLGQHIRSQQHKRLVAERAREKIGVTLQPTKVKCAGLSVQECMGPMAECVEMWHSWRVKCAETKKHTYMFLDDVHHHTLRL